MRLFWSWDWFSLLVRYMKFRFDKSSLHWGGFLWEFPIPSGVWGFDVLKWTHDRFQGNCRDQDLNLSLSLFLLPILSVRHLNTIITPHKILTCLTTIDDTAVLIVYTKHSYLHCEIQAIYLFVLQYLPATKYISIYSFSFRRKWFGQKKEPLL